MSLRINLLRNDELREAGALSQGFMIRLSIMIAVGLLVVGVGLMVLHSHNTKQGLLQSRARFRKQDPLYQDVKAMKEDLEANKKLIRELESLAKSRITWHETLMDLRAIIPETMSLSRMMMRDSVQMLKFKAWEKKSPVPARSFVMNLDGRIQDQIADAVVVQLIRDLNSSDKFEPLMASVELKGQGLKREMGGRNDGQNRWVFGIEAIGKPREMRTGDEVLVQKPKKGSMK